MIEKRVYNHWAFSENAMERRDINYEIYKELTNKYKITLLGQSNEEKNILNKNDIVIQFIVVDYACNVFKVIKNEPNLTMDELALICDNGNLCFGYRYNGNVIRVYTD